MNPISVIGAFIMTLAFLAYGIGSVTLERFRIVGNVVLIFMNLAVMLHFVAVAAMIIGNQGSGLGLHMWIGGFAFLLLIVNLIWIWLLYIRKGIDALVDKSLLIYTKSAYFIWVLTYLSEFLILIWV
jgi:hypothetical protein